MPDDSPEPLAVFARIERIIARDPGRRGIGPLVRPGHLERACRMLREAPRVALLTGFFIPTAQAAETDGPPGAAALQRVLQTLGKEAVVLTDQPCAAVCAGSGAEPMWVADGDATMVSSADRSVSVTLAEVSAWLVEATGSCMVSIERCGRGADGRYRTMRARDISEWTAPLDELFLEPPGGVRRIAVGDGGNEIGMGIVAELVATAIPGGAAIGSRVGCDDLIVAGVSNWGAWGLIAGLSLLCGRDLLPTLDEARRAVAGAVAAGAVDGVAGLPQTTVDGLGFEHHRDVLLALSDAVRR